MVSNTTVSKQNIEAIYPLTPMQEGLLFQTLSSGSLEYFQQMTYTLCGELNVAALKRAWDEVIARHAVLRTLFKWERLEKPIQIVLHRVRLLWQEEDWRGTAADEQEERWVAALIANKKLGFNLSKAPLMRMMLMQEAADRYKFVWSYHHLLMDGWSAATVCQEVFTLYEAHCHGRNIDLPRVRPFRDYIDWLVQQDFSQAETYWRQRLKGFKTPTPLGDSRRFNLATNQEDYLKEGTKLSEALLSAVQRFARQSRVTMNTVMKGVWALLLSRYSRQQDVVFGTVVSGRPAHLEGVEAMVGVFINTIPVRVQIREDESVLEWLAALQAEQFEMQQCEYTPMIKIKGWSEVPRAQPLFESLLVFQNFPQDFYARQGNGNSQRPDLSVALELEESRNNYPLTLGIGPDPGALVFLYDRRRFKGTDIDRMLNHIETLLAYFVENPNVKLSEVAQVLDDADRKAQLAKEINFKEARALKLRSIKRNGAGL